MPTADPVARYYDSNTRRFLMVGGAGASHTLHRQLWAPGVRSVREASDYVHRLIVERIRALASDGRITLLDMGCGVGGTLFDLGEAFPHSRLHGITISRRQWRIANRLADRKGLRDRCHVHLGDYHCCTLSVEADVIVAIESFVHTHSPRRFFASVSRHLKPGGILMIVDDFLGTDSLDPPQRSHVEDFKSGWRAPGLCTRHECLSAAREVGLAPVDHDDLSSLVRLGRPRDRVISRLTPLLKRLGLVRFPFFGNMVGGNALQVGLREGFLEYRLLLLRAAEVV